MRRNMPAHQSLQYIYREIILILTAMSCHLSAISNQQPKKPEVTPPATPEIHPEKKKETPPLPVPEIQPATKPEKTDPQPEILPQQDDIA